MAFLDTNHQRAAFLIFVLGAGIAVAVAPYATGLIGAPVLYVVTASLHSRLARHCGRAGAAVLVIVLLAFLLLIPGAAIARAVVGEIREVAATLFQNPEARRLDEFEIGGFAVGPMIMDAGSEMLTWLSRNALGLMGTAARILLNLVFALFGLYFILVDPAKAWRAVSPYIPFSDPNTLLLAERFRNVTLSTLIGIILVAAVQGALTSAAFFVAGFPNVFFWGLVAVVLSIIPVVGAFCVWAPGAFFLFLDGRHGASIAMIMWGAFVISSVDNIIRPIVYRRWAKIHPILTLVGAVAGIQYFGLLGLLIGPLALSYFFELGRMYREEYLPAPSS